jgi:hypothetical protein
MRIFGMSYALIALIVAAITTFMQVQPALFFIDLLTGSDNKFPATAVFLLTALMLLLPLIPVLMVINRGNKKRNEMPDITGKTGIIVRRKKSLSNALYDSAILVDGQFKSSVSNGKSTFIELAYGHHHVQVKGHKSAEISIDLKMGEVLELQMAFVDDGGLKVKVLLERIEVIE